MQLWKIVASYWSVVSYVTSSQCYELVGTKICWHRRTVYEPESGMILGS